MDKELLLFTELDDESVERLLRYSLYTDKSLDNIKSKVNYKKSLISKGFSRRILLVAVVLLLGTGAVLAAATNLDRVYQTLFGGQAEYIQDRSHKMELITEAEGIEVEIISMSIYNQDLNMIVLIRDKEGSRIDETTNFFTTIGYDEKDEETSIQYTRNMFNFNEETGELIFVDTAFLPPDVEIKEITYTISFIQSGLIDRFGEVQIDLYSTVADHIPSTVPASSEYPKYLTPEETHISFSDIDWSCVTANSKYQKLLTPEETRILFPEVDWSYISNIGFVDGRLHVQVKDDQLRMPDYPWLVRGRLSPLLIGSDGTHYIHFENDENEVVREYTLQGRGKKDDEMYREYVFTNITDIEQLKDMTLAIAGPEHTELIDAEWPLKFKLSSENEPLTIPIKMAMPVAPDKELFADSIVVTPLSVNITFLVDNINDLDKTDYLDTLADRQFITYNDGTIFEFRFNGWSNTFLNYPDKSEKKEVHAIHERRNLVTEGIKGIIEIEKVKSVTIQGMEFYVEK